MDTEQYNTNLVPFVFGQGDALNGLICCPEMYFVRRDDQATYAAGWASINGHTETTRQIIDIDAELQELQDGIDEEEWIRRGANMDLMKQLTRPFEPQHITWKPGATKESKCMALAFADLRAYQDRLDEVCGLDWCVEYQPWGDNRIIARLTIGTVTRCSTGEMDGQDEKNGMGGTVAEAQAFKRAASMFGLGRYLYDLPSVWIDYDAQKRRIAEVGLAELDSRYKTWYAKKVAFIHKGEEEKATNGVAA